MTIGIYDPRAVSSKPPAAEIGSFAELVATAAADGQGQRLLVVLVRVEPAYRTLPDGRTVPIEGEGGLHPVMVKDFPLAADTRLDHLIREADRATADWQFLMVAVLAGSDGRTLGSADAEPHLKRMAETLMTGGSLRAYAFFDRDGDPVLIQDPS